MCSSLPARLMEEFPASKVHLQPAYIQTLLASLGVVIGQNSDPQSGEGFDGPRAKLAHSMRGEGVSDK